MLFAPFLLVRQTKTCPTGTSGKKGRTYDRYTEGWCDRGTVRRSSYVLCERRNAGTGLCEAEANQETTEETESEPETTAAPVETEPVTSGVADGPYAWWSGDWYGWWVIRNGGGQFEDWVDSWWDACATIEVYDDSTGFIFLWDDSNEAGEGFCYADDWFDYYIILRPWGTEWEDIRNADTTNLPYDDMMPLSYDSWYLPLIRSGVTKAPESFGETEPGAPVMTWRIRSVPSRSDKAKKEAA